MINVTEKLKEIHDGMKYIIISIKSNRLQGAIARIEYSTSLIKLVINTLNNCSIEKEEVVSDLKSVDKELFLKKELIKRNKTIKELREKLAKYSFAGRNTDSDMISCENLLNHIDRLKLKIKKECDNPEYISFYNLAVRDIETEIRIQRFANNHK